MHYCIVNLFIVSFFHICCICTIHFIKELYIYITYILFKFIYYLLFLFFMCNRIFKVFIMFHNMLDCEIFTNDINILYIKFMYLMYCLSFLGLYILYINMNICTLNIVCYSLGLCMQI